MALIRSLPVILVFAIDIFALVDVIISQDSRFKSLNKLAWILIILFIPLIGAILWFTLGRERPVPPNSGSGHDTRRYDTPRVLAPDDDPVFLHNATRFEEQEARIRRLEAELKALDDEKPKE
jgi:hypothetical protein